MKQKKHNGLTLLELLIALSIVIVLSGGVFLSFRQTPQRVLHSALIQMQADLRYAQRRAIIEGRRVSVEFDSTARMYRIIIIDTGEEIRRVYLDRNITIGLGAGTNRVTYLPRGSVSGARTISLTIEGVTKRLSITPASGRTYLLDS